MTTMTHDDGQSKPFTGNTMKLCPRRVWHKLKTPCSKDSTYQFIMHYCDCFDSGEQIKPTLSMVKNCKNLLWICHGLYQLWWRWCHAKTLHIFSSVVMDTKNNKSSWKKILPISYSTFVFCKM